MGRAAGSVDRDGFELEFFREGSGIPMLVVAAPNYYRRVLPQSLRDCFEIVFCDLRLWTPSPPGFDLTTVTRDTYSDDIEAVRQAVGLDRPVIFGHSIHGTLALEYARRYPEQTRGVVAVGAHPVGYNELWKAEAEFFQADAEPARLKAHERNLASRRVPTTLDNRQDFIDQYVANAAIFWFDPTFDATELWEETEPNLPVFSHLIGKLYQDYRLAPLDVPVFLAQGRYDYDVPSYLWDEPRKRLLNHQYYQYARSGHTPPFEEPERFASDLWAWAKSL